MAKKSVVKIKVNYTGNGDYKLKIKTQRHEGMK